MAKLRFKFGMVVDVMAYALWFLIRVRVTLGDLALWLCSGLLG